jgi:hypothetical protein
VKNQSTLAAAVCLMVLCHGASAVSPAAGSDMVLSLHSQAQGELQLQYSRDVAGQNVQTTTVGLGGDYHYTRDPGGLRLYDYRLRRIYSVDASGRFTNDSLYAQVWFRATELESRVRLRKAMQAAGLPMDKVPTAQDPFWMESDLGLLSPDLPVPAVQHSELDGRNSWVADGAEVVAVRYDPEPVPEAVKGGLRRFWSTFVQIHPSIADDLAASGKIPQELWVTSKPTGAGATLTHWKLIARHWQPQAHYPLPPHLVAAPTQVAGVFPEIFALLSKEVANRATPPAHEAYVARAQAAIDRGAGIEALLTLTEMNLAEGHPTAACATGDPREFCALAVKAGPLVRSDARYAVAFAQQSPALSDRPQFDTLANAYLLRLLWATRPAGKDVSRDMIEHDLLAALSTAPIADFTKDTGDFYAAGWQPFAAWQVWDLGRLMAGHQPDDLLHGIDSLEDQLYVGLPSLF